MLTRRELLLTLGTVAAGAAKTKYLYAGVPSIGGVAPRVDEPAPGLTYHGYVLRNFTVDTRSAHLVLPNQPLPGRPWIWRTMFWDAFPGFDLAMLQAGFHLAFIDVGNTFGCPDAMKHFDVFYDTLITQYHLSRKPALEGLSRGGLYAYRWAYKNAGKIGCIYGDAPVCDMKSWPGGKGKGKGSPSDWQEAIKDYHFSGEKEMMAFDGNPIDILRPIAEAHVPIIHVCGDADTTVPEDENTDIVRARYMAMGGAFVLIVKEGCDHHPHGLANPEPVVNFVLAHCAKGHVQKIAAEKAPKPGTVIRLSKGQW